MVVCRAQLFEGFYLPLPFSDFFPAPLYSRVKVLNLFFHGVEELQSGMREEVPPEERSFFFALTRANRPFR